MRPIHSLSRIGACLAIALAVGGANLPRAMNGPGAWEVGRSAGSEGERVCLPDPAMLMQWEHRARQCTRVIVSSSVDHAVVQYTCSGGGFGTSRVEILTPRSVKVATQGIADGGPFGYVVHARRVGNCAAR